MKRPKMHFVCPECGPHVPADEDGCCATCGADCKGAKCRCKKAVLERAEAYLKRKAANAK